VEKKKEKNQLVLWGGKDWKRHLLERVLTSVYLLVGGEKVVRREGGGLGKNDLNEGLRREGRQEEFWDCWFKKRTTSHRVDGRGCVSLIPAIFGGQEY